MRSGAETSSCRALKRGFLCGRERGEPGCGNGNVSVGRTIHSRKIDSPVDAPVHEVEVLGHLFENEQMASKEELSVEDGQRGVLRLQRFSGADEGLLAIIDRFLRQVIEDGGLPDVLAPQRGHETGRYLDEVLQLGKHPNGFLESWIPSFLLVQGLELEELAHALLLLNLRTRKRFSCG